MCCFLDLNLFFCKSTKTTVSFPSAAEILLMLSIRFWHTSNPILSQSTCTLSHSSKIPAGAFSYSPSLFLRWFHRCSMGLISGDWAGHGRTLNPCSLNQVVAFLHLCFWAIILMKDDAGGVFTIESKAFLKLILQDLGIKLPIHPSINLACIPNTIPQHTPPHHQRSTSKLGSLLHQPITQALPSLLSAPNPPIWP